VTAEHRTYRADHPEFAIEQHQVLRGEVPEWAKDATN
jgi:hypothetical protein